MPWKDILVFTDDTAPEGVALVRATQALAGPSQAHVEVQILIQAPPNPDLIGTPALEAAYRKLLGFAQARGSDASAVLRAESEVGERLSIYHQAIALPEAKAFAAVHARASDLVVMGQPQAGDRRAFDLELLTGVLFGGGRPCLMLPRWPGSHPWGRRALIAWKSSPQAARAVHAALPLLRRAESVRLLCVDPRGEAEGEDARSLTRLATHLARNGVSLEAPATTQSTLGEVGRVIVDEAEGFGADLLVMGAYGHTRFTEFVFGGATREIIERASYPVLFSH